MKINGTEREFLFSIGAFVETSKMCPDGNIERIGEIVGGNTSAVAPTILKLACILNEQAEMWRKFNGKPHHQPLTESELMALSFTEFAELSKAVMGAMAIGQQTEVELQGEKKTETAVLD